MSDTVGVPSRAMICRAYTPGDGITDVVVFARFTEAKVAKMVDRMNVVKNHTEEFDSELICARFDDTDFFKLYDYHTAVEQIQSFYEEHEDSLSDAFESTRFNLANSLSGSELDINNLQMVVNPNAVYWSFYEEGDLREADGMFRRDIEALWKGFKDAPAL